MTPADIDSRFTYRAPTADKVTQHERVRAQAKSLADDWAATLPGGRELATAITKLEEALFWANAAVARNG